MMSCGNLTALTMGIAAMLFEAALCGTAAADRSAPIGVQLEVIGDGSVDASEIDRARAVAKGLLARAGVNVEWCDRSTMTGCASDSTGSHAIPVLLASRLSAAQSRVSGEVTGDGSTQSPTVVVYVPAVEDRVRDIRMSGAGRSNPLLAGLRVGHLLGLTIAHEVGHTLGVRHSASGVMQAYLDVDDVLAMREGYLAFAPAEAARMRMMLEQSCRSSAR
jgi:hypothetical protein